ncbi:unnamed protein product [Heterobilharzia americana]|nr:unnamed protein product [Heterobilharzia americana]
MSSSIVGFSSHPFNILKRTMSQRWQVNLVVMSLLIINVVKIQAATYLLPMKFDESGQMYIEFDGRNISLSSEFILTVKDDDCTKTLSLKPPTKNELFARNGYRPASW